MSVMSILLQKHNPDQYAKDKAAESQVFAEKMAFVEGMKAALIKEVKAPEFVTDSNSPTGFSPTDVAKSKTVEVPKRALFKDQSTKAQEQIIAGGLRQFFD